MESIQLTIFKRYSVQMSDVDLDLLPLLQNKDIGQEKIERIARFTNVNMQLISNGLDPLHFRADI